MGQRAPVEYATPLLNTLRSDPDDGISTTFRQAPVKYPERVSAPVKPAEPFPAGKFNGVN
jgi:hypothetical protein